MTRKMIKKYLLLIGVMIMVLAITIPTVAAYEGHRIDVRAHLKGEILATRTPGYWQTHYWTAKFVFEEILGSSIDMGWPDEITNMNDLEGIFWANIAKESDDDPRSSLCKWKEKCAWQGLAAILNSACPKGAPLPISLEDMQDIMSGSDTTALEALHTLLSDFNKSGDSDCLPLGLNELAGYDIEHHADPDTAQQVAHLEFADCLPGE
jgi:hypothetical protein